MRLRGIITSSLQEGVRNHDFGTFLLASFRLWITPGPDTMYILARSVAQALDAAQARIGRLYAAGFELLRNDRRIVLLGQLLTTLANARDADPLAALADVDTEPLPRPAATAGNRQQRLFD